MAFPLLIAPSQGDLGPI